MVSVFAFYSHGPSSNTAEILCCKLFEKNEKEARDGQFFKKLFIFKNPFYCKSLGRVIRNFKCRLFESISRLTSSKGIRTKDIYVKYNCICFIGRYLIPKKRRTPTICNKPIFANWPKLRMAAAAVV